MAAPKGGTGYGYGGGLGKLSLGIVIAGAAWTREISCGGPLDSGDIAALGPTEPNCSQCQGVPLGNTGNHCPGKSQDKHGGAGEP